MSNNSRSQVGGKRTPPQANNSQDGARSKGPSKKDKKLSGKDKKTKEEIKKKKDVNNKKCVLAPPEPVPSNIELSSEGKNEVLTPEAGAVDDFYAGTINTVEAVKEQILNYLEEARRDKRLIKDLFEGNFFSLCDCFWDEINRRKVLKQVGGKRTPPQANNSQDGARSKEPSKKKDVNNKKCVLAPPEPVPSNIELSSEGNDENLTPEANAEAMADCYSGMIDHICKKMKAISLNEKNYESLKEAKTVEERIKVLYDCASSCLCDPKFKKIIRRKVLKEVGGKRIPPQANNSEDGARPKGTSKEKDKESSAPPQPVPSNMELSSEGNDEVLTPEAVVVANSKTGTVTVEDVRLFIFNCFRGASTDKRIKDVFELNFSHLCDYYRKVVNQRKVLKEATTDKPIKDLYELNFSYLVYYYWEANNIREANIQGEKDKKKFDVARKLGKDHLHIIRKKYQQEWNSDDWDIRQRAVELYLIDKVYENIKEFMEGKEKNHLLFHRVIPSELNSYLESHMLGLTASVFRTYNASITLQNKLEELTAAEDSIPSKVLAFKYAVRATAVLLNHRRAVPLAFDSQMANLQDKVKAKMTAIKNAKKDLKSVRNEYKQSRNEKMKQLVERKKKTVERLEDQLAKLKMKAKHKEDFKDVNIATTIGYYLDPLIIVAWCKKWDVPVKNVYNKSQRNKFRWAIDMAEKDYEF